MCLVNLSYACTHTHTHTHTHTPTHTHCSQDVYGVSLLPPSKDRIDAYCRFIDRESLGASLLQRNSSTAVFTALPLVEDTNASLRIDPLAQFPLAASPAPRGPRGPSRNSAPPSVSYNALDLVPQYPSAFTTASQANMGVYVGHIDAGHGWTLMPPLNAYYAYVQAPLLVLDTLTKY